ncbi:MAG: Tetratricopeptide (TPR) repeat/Tfp pilus assembly protein PilF/Tfp pilus assembly protein PilF [Verrucomicrobia bacterium]|nr:MAG: Tetratricopeptide (TPR) repeat/Tfp pilus assembly protein PilF/Tfp pilus assembly protein PilF [Verrucomicrobiota bacterium]
MWGPKEEVLGLPKDSDFTNWASSENADKWKQVKEDLGDDARKWMGEMGLRQLAADWFRLQHPGRLGSFVLTDASPAGSSLRVLIGEKFIEPLVHVAVAHSWDRSRVLNDEALDPHEIGEDPVNLRFLAALLRLGDLLDLGEKRISTLVWSYLRPLNPLSEAHWRKENLLQVRNCTSDVIEVGGTFDIARGGATTAAAYQLATDWTNWIELEIRDCTRFVATLGLPEYQQRCRMGALKFDRSKLKKVGDLPVAAPPAPVSSTLQPCRPESLPPPPDDFYPETAGSFIGRESQLGLGVDAVEGLMSRFRTGNADAGSRGIRLIWAHGFGGMGKSWFLHRVRCLAQDAHPEVRPLLVDWDKGDWRAPLTGEPRSPEELFRVLAIRLAQQLGMEVADPYWLAEARVRASAKEHRATMDKFESQLQLATTDGGRTDSVLLQLLTAGGQWHDDLGRRTKHIDTLRRDPRRHRELFAAWCRETGLTDGPVICPHRERAEGLRAVLRAAMERHPLILLLDTCEVLSDDLDNWLRELLAPLFREPLPLLVLVGSRLRPDLHQPPATKHGWRVEIPQAVLRVEDFGENLRFTVSEITFALGLLAPPVEGDLGTLAESLHRITLGVPLAVRGLLDLHRDGDSLLTSLTAPADDDVPLAEREAIRHAVGQVCRRFLLNLVDHPERAEDLRDIVALAILPGVDTGLLRLHWNPKPARERLRELARRYSLVSDGDLHPSVRSYLRRFWRSEDERPDCFTDVLSGLRCCFTIAGGEFENPTPAERVTRTIAELNLRSWDEGDAITADAARVLCLARVYEVDSLPLESLLRELPLAGPANAAARALWPRDFDESPSMQIILPWLRRSCDTARPMWSAEESAALSLLSGTTGISSTAQPETLLAAHRHLETAVAHFTIDLLPISIAAGEAFFEIAHGLDPFSPSNANRNHPPFLSALAYERAIALGHLASVAWNNVANIYAEHLGEPAKAEEAYRRAIELDPENGFPHHGLGNLYQYHLGEHAKAEGAYRRATELEPRAAAPHNGLGNLYLDHLGEPAKAEEAYRRAIELDSENAFPHHGLGNLYQYHHGEPEKAEVAYRRAIELDPKNAAPHHGLGNLYRDHLGEPEKAEEAYRRAIELDPKNALPHNGLGNLYRDHLGELAKAEEAYRRAIELDPKLDLPHCGLGSLYEDYLGEPAKAEEAYRRAIELDPGNAFPHYCLVSLYRDHLEEPAKAEEAYRRAIELDPENAAPHHGLGNLYRDHLGEPAKAEEAYRRAIELDPENAAPHHGLGNLYRDHLGEPAKAEEAYRRAIELDPENAFPHYDLGNLYRDHLGEPAKAEASCRRAIELDPENAVLHHCLGNLYRDHIGEPTKAEASYRRAIELDPKLGLPHCGLGRLYEDYLGEPAKAEEAYRRAIELDPENAFPHYDLGNLYRDRLGAPAKAEASYRRAIELNPKIDLPHCGLGSLYEDYLGEPAKAEEAYRRAIELNPENAFPHYGLGGLYKDYLGEPAKAEEAYRRAIELNPKSAQPHLGLGALFQEAGRWVEAIAAFQRALALDRTSGAAQRGMAWVALRSSGNVEEARRWADEAGKVDPSHPGTLLAGMAVEAWAHGWPAIATAFPAWVQEPKTGNEAFLWSSRQRLAALLRRMHARGELEAAAAVLRVAASRACWQPWAAAVDALLADTAKAQLSDQRSRTILELLRHKDSNRH